ncbi:protein translocase subunit SecD [Salinibacterium sp. NSLL150]|uniref:protein translocase subunit SecD n=1 Tax=unclassified Salinibacterium TaxID=2632331 RepID=UPI0018CEEC9A|nr:MULTISPECIES: protein translocase subunit SecD [unclassified Salinibacterium]MBH0099044.1 protein translocase subunit SecD [Salinibacterium sp. NSLL35]MBH0101798.1 protein translocase subunit SecD [Salinibacterium sp. NSLL150]MBH0104558.1 protein translocase subunit SecD [Salinibacterium sp. NSLL16]MBH0107318.1 protein translocase subunit SecD [Salinibacterium sp. NSLL17]MBH0108905.1 protein translocase subunit SecD [Salinibacterium sp. NG22]
MARTTPVKNAWRAIVWLTALTVGLAVLIGAGSMFGAASWAPKLALDLEGGTQIVLAPQLESGQTVTGEQLTQAVSIIRDRVDASGVAEAEVTTQGASNVVVSIPGVPDEETLKRIQSSAKLEFRPVLYTDVAATSTATETPEPTDTATPDGETATPTPEPTLATTPTAAPTDASDLNWITEALFDEFTNFDCASLDNFSVAPAGEALITCDSDGLYKYILGPVEVEGSTITDASSGLVTSSQGISTGQWGVFPTFNAEGTADVAEMTTRLFGFDETDPRNRFGIVLDGQVISAPTTQGVITGGNPQISGSFTQETAEILADQLKFGALPIGFEVQSSENISATLGSNQLNSGLIAGLIGLLLVVIYSLFQYRLLGLVTVASLIVAGVLTYLVIAYLSWRHGYRLSLAGVAGLIVAIGFTADSFIVYFERIRDELRDGRSLTGAVEAGWKRALRTIFAAKAVNLLSAVVLFVLAVGNVRGFALTLGITTVIDVLVVVLFTHPVLQLLATTRFFSSGHRLSGLDPNALGAIYRGRAQFRTPAPSKNKTGASREAARRQTIAERKAAELAGTASDASSDGKDS